MAKLVQESLEDTNATTSVSISGPAYMVAVGGAPRGSRAKNKWTSGEECCITSRYLNPSTGSCHDKCKDGMQDEWLEIRRPANRFGSRIASRYLLPSIGSCHDRCKHGMQDEWLEIRRPAKRLGSRRKSFIKNKGIKRNVVPVERKKMTKTKPKPSPNPKVYLTAEPVGVTKLRNSLPLKKFGDSNQNERKTPKRHPTTVKTKPIMVNNSSSRLNASAGLNSGKRQKHIKTITVTKVVPKSTFVERVASKAIQTGSVVLNRSGSKTVSLKGINQSTNQMTKTKLKQLIAEKVSEMPLHEIIEVPPTLEMKSTSPPNSESNPSSFDQEVLEEESSIIAPLSGHIQTSNEQVSKLESEHADDEEVAEEECEYTNEEENIILEDDNEMKTSEEKLPRRYRVVICEDGDDDESKLKFRRGRNVEQSDEDGPGRLKFRRGRILDDDGDRECMVRLNFKKKEVEALDDCEQSENVKLKHQKVQEKEVQELLNSVIEETASKLLEDMKRRKVEALVGAFETVISRQEDTLPSSTESRDTS